MALGPAWVGLRKIVCGAAGVATVRGVLVEFLTDDQAGAYGKFREEPTRPELERFFFLDDVDRDLIALRRTRGHRLGFAVQMCTVRYVGLFLEDLLAVPWPVVEYLAEQLGIEDPSCVKAYTERSKTAYEHAWEIRDAYGYHAYEDVEWCRKFRTFLHARAWTHAEGPVGLFDHAVSWLRRHRVLLPGVSVLARQVVAVREAADRRLHSTVVRAAYRAGPGLPGVLVALLDVPPGAAILGAGAVEAGCDADHGHRDGRRVGPGERDRCPRAGAGGSVPGAAEPVGGLGPVRVGQQDVAAGPDRGTETHGAADGGGGAVGGGRDR